MAALTADPPVVPPGAQVDTGPVRKAAVKGLQSLAAEVAKTYPETTIHRHITDAADQVRIGNDEGAMRHLKAAHASLQPQSLRRFGVNDDGGHVAGRQAIEGVVRHQLMIRDLQDAEARNQEAIGRDSYGDDTTAPRHDPNAGYGPGALAQKPTARQPGGNRALNAPARIPAGRTGADVASPDAPNRRGSKQFARTWDEVGAVLDMATGDDCYRCKTPNAPDAMHCKRCGFAMEPRQPYDRFADEDITCPFCGRGDSADSTFCDQCGKRLPETPFAAFAGRRRAVEMSARTPMLESTPAPYGEPGGPGLYRVKNNKHSDYFENVVQALMHKRGMSKERASAMAWAALRRWQAKSKHPEVRAAASRGLMQEAQAQTRAHGHANSWDELAAVVVELAAVQVKTYQRTVNTPRGPVVQTVTTHQQNYKNGMGGAPAPAPSGQQGGKSPWQQMPSRSAEKQRLLSTAASYKRQAALLQVEEAALNSALYRALYGSNTTQAQAGATTAAQAGATTAAQSGATAPSASQKASTAAATAGATPAQVSQTAANAAAAAAKMSVPQLRAAIASVKARITWLDNQAAQLTAQAQRLP